MMLFMPVCLLKRGRQTKMNDIRNYTIIIGSKAYFSNQIVSILSGVTLELKNDFMYMVRKHDEHGRRVSVSGISPEIADNFEKTEILIVRNDDYHGIVETAHDRLGALIEDLTTEVAQILIHNPTITLEDYLRKLKSQGEIELNYKWEKYEMLRDSQHFVNNINSIFENIIGQEEAVNAISKSIWYLTHTNRKKPFVVMLYGNSSIGKTEMVREIATQFFNGKVFEKHLSMFKNNTNAHYLFGDNPNRTSIGFELLERESNLIFLDEFDKLPDYFYSIFYTLFDNTIFSDTTYRVDISGLLIFLTSNYTNKDEMKKHLGLPIFYRIDKFIHFNDFTVETVYKIANKEIARHVNESNGQIDADNLYSRVSCKLHAKGENARTIKYVVQQEVEDLLFEEVKAENIAT